MPFYANTCVKNCWIFYVYHTIWYHLMIFILKKLGTYPYLDDFETQFRLPSDAVELCNLFCIKASGRNVCVEQNMCRISQFAFGTVVFNYLHTEACSTVFILNLYKQIIGMFLVEFFWIYLIAFGNFNLDFFILQPFLGFQNFVGAVGFFFENKETFFKGIIFWYSSPNR